ncbi:MAG: metallophosphoesterase [Haloferacaceae archaeon]
MSTVDLGDLRVAFRDRACYLPAADALVAADLHLGRAAASDVAYPLGERGDLRERLTDALARFAPSTVAFAGDLVHRFETVPERTAAGLRALTDVCRDAGARPVLVAGNHDTALGTTRDGDLHDEYRLADGTVVCHGHAEPRADAPRYVIGHDHPAITVEGHRRPCLLYGEGVYRGADLLVLPAFTPLAPGVRVGGMDAADFDSPLVCDAGALRPVVHDPDADEALAFPPLGRFRDML